MQEVYKSNGIEFKNKKECLVFERKRNYFYNIIHGINNRSGCHDLTVNKYVQSLAIDFDVLVENIDFIIKIIDAYKTESKL